MCLCFAFLTRFPVYLCFKYTDLSMRWCSMNDSWNAIWNWPMLVIIKYTHSRCCCCCCCCGCGNCCSCVNPYNVTMCSFFSSFFISFFSVFVVVMLFSACHCHFAFISISLNILTRIKCVITIPLLVANNIVFFLSCVSLYIMLFMFPSFTSFVN